MKTATNNLADYLEQQTHLMTAHQVSDLLGITKDTVYRRAQSGDLPAIAFASRIRFDPKQLAVWVREHQHFPKRGLSFHITNWMEEQAFRRNGPRILPVLLQKAMSSIDYDWRAAVSGLGPERSSSPQKFRLLDDFRTAVDTLPPEQQRGILADIRSGRFDQPVLSEEL